MRTHLDEFRVNLPPNACAGRQRAENISLRGPLLYASLTPGRLSAAQLQAVSGMRAMQAVVDDAGMGQHRRGDAA